MNLKKTDTFNLPARLAAKDNPALIEQDQQHFAAIAARLDASIREATDRLAAARRSPGGHGQAALDRDQDVHRLSSNLRTLGRFGLDLCLGRTVGIDDDTGTSYIGRSGMTDSSGDRLLVDWRSPAAEPFFGATHGDPMGLTSRRRYRWTNNQVTDFWDEVFTPDALVGNVALDDQSAFIASLTGSRTSQMRDVLGTIQADQDTIIRAGSRGALVVDGGPGTGKTVVALHRTAYLLYSDPRLGHRRGGVLFVGPHQQYLSYVADVLPNLGEEGVRTCTVADLVPDGAGARREADPEVARVKASVAMVGAIETAVRFYETPPTNGVTAETPWGDVRVSVGDWAEAFAAADPGVPHNDARDLVWDELVAIVTDRLPTDEDVPAGLLSRSLRASTELTDSFGGAWPLLDATELVGDLWTVPAYLRLCAPWLQPDEVTRLQRRDPHAWTDADLPLLDAARRRLGDPAASRRRRRQSATRSAEKARMADVVADLIRTDDSEMSVMSMLRGEDLQDALVDESASPDSEHDLLAGPFAHIVVDEAQELTDAEWQMLVHRCPSRSFTIVGDRAQARRGFAESWADRLARVGIEHCELAHLRVNYRTPEEIMTEAEPAIRAVLPGANVPVSVRTTGIPVTHGTATDLRAVLDAWLAEHDDAVACVIGDPSFAGTSRVRSLTPETAKGLEFDLVVLVDPEAFGDGIEGSVDRYVSMTRATEKLVVLTRA